LDYVKSLKKLKENLFKLINIGKQDLESNLNSEHNNSSLNQICQNKNNENQVLLEEYTSLREA